MMGRELKRVPLDFRWPEDTVWEGYVNPHYAKCRPCAACDATGNTISSRRLGDLVSLLLLSGSDAQRGACHPYLVEAPLYETRGYVCEMDILELTSGLTGRSPSSFGHDACDRWSAKKKIIAAAGLSEEWGECPVCAGNGHRWDSPEDEQASDAWTRTEPPTGDGYQIWETVSEGSPISPVFATPEELARHMAGRKWGADHGSSYESWLSFITGPGWALSMVMDESGIRTGPDAAVFQREPSA